MNNAGRIGFVIKGNYDNTTTYDFLDVVYFRNASYVAKKLTTGNEPETDSEYWQVLAKLPDGTVTGIKGAAESSFRDGDVTITPENIGALPISGGTVTGNLNVGNNVKINTDQDGGNIRITAPNGQYYEIDAFDSNLRIYTGNNVNGITGQMSLTKTGQLSATGGFLGNADMVDGKHASDLMNYNNLTNKPKYVTSVSFSGSDYVVKYSDSTREEGQIAIDIATATGSLTKVISNSYIYYYVTISNNLSINTLYKVTRMPNYTTQVVDDRGNIIPNDIYIGGRLERAYLVISNNSGSSSKTVPIKDYYYEDFWIPASFNFTYNGSSIVVTNITF